MQAVIDYMKVMNVELQHIRNRDAKMVQQAIPLLMKACSYVRVSKDKDFSGKLMFLLRREAKQEPLVWLEYLFSTLLSTKSTDDLLKLNPYLSNENLKRIMKLTIIAILRSSRVGHTNRCISAAQKLEKKLKDILKLNESLKVKDPMISKRPKKMKNKHPLYKIGLLFLRPR